MKFIKIICIFILSSILAYGETQISINKIIRDNWSQNTLTKSYKFTLKSRRSIKISLISRAGGPINIRLNDESGQTLESSTYYVAAGSVQRRLDPGTYIVKVEKYDYNSTRNNNFMLKVDGGTSEIFIGRDNSIGGLTNSNKAKNSFTSNLTSIYTEDFENVTHMESVPYHGMGSKTKVQGTLNFGSGGTAFLDQSGNTSSIGIADKPYDGERAISGTKYLSAGYASFTLTFSSPVSAFGFYITDLGDGSRFHRSIAININYTNGGRERYKMYGLGDGSVGYFGFIQNNPNKIISSVSLYNYGDFFDYDACGYDDFSIATDEEIKYQDENNDNLPSINHPYFSDTWVDTDNDGIANNIDSDDDGDGISDVQEVALNMNPLNATDAQADFDYDGFSNLIEITIGTNIRNSNSKPIWAPILMDDLMMFVPAKP